MISNVCRIEKGTNDLEAILNESEKVAVFNELDHKQTMQLRLLCEEIDGMLPNIIDDFNGDFWIEFNDGVCKLKLNLTFKKFTVDKKKELINIATNKKNAFAKGLIGKIRSAIENLFLDKELAAACNIANLFNYANGYSVGMDSSYLWNLDDYRKSLKKDESPEEWDELEKSIIASLADNVIVGIKGMQANIEVIKNFK